MALSWRGLIGGLVAAMALLGPPCAQAQWSVAWRKAESAHFVVYSDFDENELRTNIDKLEDFDALLRRFDGAGDKAGSSAKFKVFLVLGQRDVEGIFPGAPDQTAGLLVNNAQDVFFVDNRRSIMRQVQDKTDAIRDPTGGWYPQDELVNRLVNYNIRYNYADKTIMAAYGPKAPAWFIAGAASFFASAQFEARVVHLGTDSRARAQLLVDSPTWISLSDVLTRRPFYMTISQMEAYRGESWLLVHYMLSDDGRREKLARYIAAVEAGADPLTSWTQQVGVSLDDLRQTLKAYAGSAQFGVTLTRAGWPHAQGLTVTKLPGAEDELILDSKRLEIDVDNDGQATVLATVRAHAAADPNDPLARLTLGRAEMLYGDPGKGASLLDAILRDDPHNVDARLGLALGHLAEGDRDPAHRKVHYDEAWQILDDTASLAPDDARVLYFRAKSQSLDTDYPTDATLADLYRAVELTPLSFEMRRGLAEALTKKRRFDDAVAVMQPLIGFRLGEITRRAVEELQDIEDQRGRVLAVNR